MVEHSERAVLDRLKRLARAWSKVAVYPNRAGGDCDVCGARTPQGQDQFLLIDTGEGERVNLDGSCYVKWMVERNKRFSAPPPELR